MAEVRARGIGAPGNLEEQVIHLEGRTALVLAAMQVANPWHAPADWYLAVIPEDRKDNVEGAVAFAPPTKIRASQRYSYRPLLLSTVSGGTYSLAGAPAALTCDQDTGQITGVPETPGQYTLELTREVEGEKEVLASFTLEVVPGE